MINIESIFVQVDKENKLLSKHEMTVYYIWNAYTWTCMEGFAGYLTGYNKDQFCKLEESFQEIGANRLAEIIKSLNIKILEYGDLDSDKIKKDIFSQSDLGNQIDYFSNCFTDYHDDWNSKLEQYYLLH